MPLQIVQIDQDYCAETYGSAPCTAAVPTTGPQKCFNTRITCQDAANYNKSTLTLSFIKSNVDAPKDAVYIPSLLNVSTNPTVLNIGIGSSDRGPLGTRASVTVQFKDHPANDLETDPYLSTRSYIASDQGTFWSKWRARNPYYQNRALRVYDGYVGQTLAQMQVRHYIIEDFSGPDASGNVTFKAKDILKLADDKKAQAPALSTGELNAAISDSATSLDLIGAEASDYPQPGTVKIGSEVMTYTTTTDNTTYITLSGLVRGTDNTTAAAHSVGDAVQWCLRFENAYSWDVVETLLTDYAGVSSSYIPTADWQTEGETWLSSFLLDDILITEPVGVTKLIGEICRDCLFFIWWDELDQEIKLKAIKPVEAETITTINDDSNILKNSSYVTEKPEERLSQIWTYYGRLDQTKKIDDLNNYRFAYISSDLEAEGVNEYGEKRVEKLYSRWLTSSAQVTVFGTRTIARYRNNPKYFKMQLDAKDWALTTGDLCYIQSRHIVDFYGAQSQEVFIVISTNHVIPGEVVEYMLQRYDFDIDYGQWTDNAANDWSSSTLEERETQGYWSDSNGEVSTGVSGPTWT